MDYSADTMQEAVDIGELDPFTHHVSYFIHAMTTQHTPSHHKLHTFIPTHHLTEKIFSEFFQNVKIVLRKYSDVAKVNQKV
ncbi:hypothetical protein EON63_18225 [archaeon]|nr:MAG: hypothetical protein EON63_18225 [archaeon]